MYLINIFPLGNICLESNQRVHMFLTHMVEKYPAYTEAARNAPGYKILDNSLIELGGAVDLERVVKAAEYIGADEIILPDVFQDGPATIKAVQSAITELNKMYPNRSWPFALQAVAQGKDESEWMDCYLELMEMPDVDVIGIPKVLAKMHSEGRPYFVNELCDLRAKPHHLLGVWYSMSELLEYKYPEQIRSCDTVLLGYLFQHNLNFWGVRPDGHTLNLEKDVVPYTNMFTNYHDEPVMVSNKLKGIEAL